MKVPFKELFVDETRRGRKLTTDNYLSKGTHPIIDQGHNQVAGYTDLEEGLFSDVPAIVFGDHTRVVKYVDEPFFLGADGTKILRPKRGDVNARYLYHYLTSTPIPNTGYNRHFKWLKELVFNLSSLPEQRHIAAVLDKADALIANYRHQLTLLDTLVQSRFHELFGDVTEKRLLGDVCTFYSGTGFPTRYQGVKHGRYPFYKVGDISRAVQSGCNYLLPADHYVEKDVVRELRGTILPKATVVFAKIGEALRLNRRALTGGECLVDNNVLGICPNTAIVGVDYFFHWMKTVDMTHYSVATTVPSVKKSTLESILIPVPRKEIQDVFGNFVHNVERQKILVRELSARANILKASLTQHWFGK